MSCFGIDYVALHELSSDVGDTVVRDHTALGIQLQDLTENALDVNCDCNKVEFIKYS